jgi:hypothetical protein
VDRIQLTISRGNFNMTLQLLATSFIPICIFHKTRDRIKTKRYEPTTQFPVPIFLLPPFYPILILFVFYQSSKCIHYVL